MTGKPAGQEVRFGPLAWLFHCLPFGAGLVFVLTCGADVPYSDQWHLPWVFDAVAHQRGILHQLLCATMCIPYYSRS
jgi:hypothetical protein